MKIRIYYNKSPHENAALYYEKAKELEGKAERAEKALEELEGKRPTKTIPLVEVGKQKRREESPFGRSITSAGREVLYGRSAEENDKIVRKMRDGDLWFHADIHGGASVVLRGGEEASEEERREAAAIAGLRSRFFSLGYSMARVYALPKGAVKPLGKGRFLMKGQRKWYEVPLKGYIAVVDGEPLLLAWRPKGRHAVIEPGPTPKDEAAKAISSFLGVDESSVKSLLPSGGIAFSLEGQPVDL